MAFEGYNGSTYDRSITENKRKSNEQKLASGQYADTHTPGKLASNVDSVLSNAQFVKDDTKVSFGSKEYDKEAFNLAAEAQRNWWENTGSKGKQYGYDMTDPEDVQRASEGRYSVAYEKSYGDDEYSQWLLANGQASQGFFESKYYKEAYDSVMLNRAEQERVKNFKKAVAQEAWSTASDTMNISGDDIAAAAQRVQIKNPQFAGIAITNTKETSGSDFSDYFSPMLAEQTAAEKEADKRATSLYLDEVADIISSYQEKQRHTNQKATEAAERNANEAQSIIDIAIKNSGYSEEIDGRVGLAKDSTLDEWNANKELKRKAATDAVGAMEVAGMSKSEIKQAIRQDGRLSYIEDSEQGIQDETTRIQRRDASDAVASDILMREAPIVQASVARAKSLANMGTAAQAGFSPISMMEGYGLSDVESAYVEKYMSDTRLALEMSGYDGLEIDNAFRRADLGEYIPKETARANYAVYTLNEMGCSNEQIEAILGSWGEEDWAAIDKDMSISDYVEDSTIDIAGKAIISVPIRAALSIISGAVGFADMVGGTISGRTETWELTDKINEQAAWWSAYSHDRNHEMISEAADIGSEMLRMYATAMMGTGLAAASTKLMSTAKGTGFLFNFISKNANRIPFVTGAIGNYYTEAMNEGTTSRQAAAYAIPAGLLEGYLESLEMGQVMRNTFGVNFVGKKIAASGLSTNFKQFAITKGMPFINFALDVIGEGAEESLSAIGSSMLRTATWDEEHQLNMTDVWQNAKGGLILGAVMGGLSMGANTQSYKYASEIYKNTGDYSKYIDSLQSAMHIENMDESKRTAILDNVEATEVTDADREAFISATAEIHNLTENIAAKKAAVEAAEQDVAVKVENAEQEVAELKKRISVLQENNGKKKADKIKELAARLNSKQKSLEQIKSEGAKKVETAIADYKAVASKANATIAKNQELIDKYHAAKYTADLEADIESDIEAVGNSADEAEHMERLSRINALLEEERAKLARLPQQQGKAALRRKEKIAQLEQRLASATDKYNASVAARTAEPTENTTAPTNTVENRIDTLKTDVAEKRERIEFLKGEIMRKSLEYEAMPEPAEDSEDTEAVMRYEELGVELDNLEDELEALTAEVEAAETAEAEPTSTPAEAATESETVTPEPALKDLGANTPTPVEMVQSKVYTNTYDRWLDDAEKLADDTGNSWYARSKEVDTLATAKSVVEGSIRRSGNLDSVMAQLQDKNAWDATDVDTAMLVAETLRGEAATTGDYAKLNEWKNVIRQNMTQSGQAIQALAKWTRNSSIAAENALVKAVDKINKDNKKKIASGKAQTVEINPELLNELQAAETAEQREEVVNRITADIGAKMPVGIIDKINAWRYLAMLGNPRTMFRNLVGNEIMSDVLWVGKDTIGTLLESGLDQSQRTKAVMVGDTYKANRDYAASTLKEAKNKLEGSSRYDTKKGVEKAIAESTPVFKLKNVEGARKLTNYALSKGDSVFLERQYKRSFAQIMTARGYAPDTITAAQKKECMEYAIAEAQRSTFHDASAVADTLSKLEQRNVVTKVLVGGVLPFKKTPINVLARGVDFSPIGLIQGTTQYLTKVKSGEMSAAQAVDKISSGLTGSALLALGVFLAKSGIITGGNEDEDKYYMSDLGYQEFALNVGDGKSITIDWAAPATIPLFMGVALNGVLEGEAAEGENKLDALINTLSGITDPLVEMSMLQGLQDTLESAAEATKNDESAIWGITKNAAYNYVSSFIPTSGGQIARTIDPVRRDTAGDPTSELGKELDKVTNKMQAKIPGIADNLEPYINIWGEQEINEHSWPVRLLENAILPGYLDEVDMTPVDVEITRLYSTTQNPDVIPSNYPYRTLKDYKTKDSYILNNTEFTEFKTENGRAMYAAVLDAINSRSYSMMDDDEKVAFISDVIKEAQEDVLTKYKKKYLNK